MRQPILRTLFLVSAVFSISTSLAFIGCKPAQEPAQAEVKSLSGAISKLGELAIDFAIRGKVMVRGASYARLLRITRSLVPKQGALRQPDGDLVKWIDDVGSPDFKNIYYSDVAKKIVRDEFKSNPRAAFQSRFDQMMKGAGQSNFLGTPAGAVELQKLVETVNVVNTPGARNARLAKYVWEVFNSGKSPIKKVPMDGKTHFFDLVDTPKGLRPNMPKFETNGMRIEENGIDDAVTRIKLDLVDGKLNVIGFSEKSPTGLSVGGVGNLDNSISLGGFSQLFADMSVLTKTDPEGAKIFAGMVDDLRTVLRTAERNSLSKTGYNHLSDESYKHLYSLLKGADEDMILSSVGPVESMKAFFGRTRALYRNTASATAKKPFQAVVEIASDAGPMAFKLGTVALVASLAICLGEQEANGTSELGDEITKANDPRVGVAETRCSQPIHIIA